ncbi:MAG: hypothetical protein LBU67_01210 [Oscillospiraceae bacterium]|jgi:hypothetical protein|nr:hypothetical protein [Oscillospiraceae bacterium]
MRIDLYVLYHPLRKKGSIIHGSDQTHAYKRSKIAKRISRALWDLPEHALCKAKAIVGFNADGQNGLQGFYLSGEAVATASKKGGCSAAGQHCSPRR